MSEMRTIPRLMRKVQAHAPSSLAAALSGQANGTQSAPALPYNAETQTGILWGPDTLELWQNGERLDIAEVETVSAHDCWASAQYVDAFPTITHWWFGSLWTQRVQVTAVKQQEDGSHRVWLQPVLVDADELMWTVPVDGMPFGPLPDYAGGEANKPLFLRLGNLALLAVKQQVPLNEWVLLTSLVSNQELQALLAGGYMTVDEFLG